MNEWIILLGWTGIFMPMALGAIGSIYGCAIAGQAAIGAMLDAESGYGKFVGISAMPSSQAIYGIVIMFSLNQDYDSSQAIGMFVIGVLSGIALLLSGIKQGVCCASAVSAAKDKPQIFGLSIAPAAIVEGFAVFAFVFALVMGATLFGG